MLRWPLHRHSGRILFASVGLFGVATLAFGLSNHFYLSLLALAVSGAVDNVSVVIRQTRVQADTPDEIRGRVSAVNSITASKRLPGMGMPNSPVASATMERPSGVSSERLAMRAA